MLDDREEQTVKPNVISEVAVRVHAIKVRSLARKMRSSARPVDGSVRRPARAA